MRLHKKILSLFFLISIFSAGFLFRLPIARADATGDASATIRKNFITPTLNVDIPGLKFTDSVSGPCSYDDKQTCIKSSYLAQYINAVYGWMIGAAVVIAIVMMMIGGLQYVLGAGVAETGKGKERIINGISGLVLLLCTYLILNTVNHQLTSLKMVELQNVKLVDMPEIDEGDVDLVAPKRLCHTIDDCKKLCDSPPPEATKADGVPVLKNTPGFINSGKAKGTSELQSGLEKAGAIAQSINANYSIRILGSESGYRSIKSQLEKACDDINNNGGKRLTNGILAWPGGSNHGSGVATDVQLFLNNKDLMTTSSKEQSSPEFKDPAQILSQIMDKAGFVRYGKEIWHFEIKGKASSYCRCNYPSCPFTPKC